MKSETWTIFMLFFVFFSSNAIEIDEDTQNEINKRVNVKGAMGNKITLTSNSTLGSGVFSFVLAGETGDGTEVAIKVTSKEKLNAHEKELKLYEKMNATMDKVCEKYGVPFIYHAGDFLDYKTMVMTMLDRNVDSLKDKFGFSRDTFLIILRDMIKALKFVHSKGILHDDIKPANMMTKGANVFLIDFNLANEKVANEWADWNTENYNMRVLFTVMGDLLDAPKTFCFSKEALESDEQVEEKKRKLKQELQHKNMKHIDLIEPFVDFCFDGILANQEKRLPKYNYFYNKFDDILYTGRNRSERIVFDWLTPEEKAAAMMETILPIESIIFPDD